MGRAEPFVRSVLLGCTALAAVAGTAPAARAQGPVRFDVPAQALSEGVLAVGRQAGVSVGVRGAAGCAARGRAVRGRFTVDQALARLLAGSGCVARRIDAQTFVVAPAAIAVSPAPPPVLEPATIIPPLLDSVVVSAARRDGLVGRTPYAISSVSSAALQAGAVTGSQALASQFAGLTATNLGAGRDKLIIRGVSDGGFTGRTQSTVGLYLDDVPITYSAPNPDLFLADVDRIELLRGPQGSLYGVGSVGGVLRIVTRRPDPGAIHASAGVQVATTAHGGPGATVNGMVNLPILRDRIAVRAVGYSEVQGGYLDNARLGLRDVNRAARKGVRLSASALLGSEWRFTTGLTSQWLDVSDGQSVQTGAGLTRATALREPHDNDFRQASATLDGKGGWGGLKLSVGYVSHDFDTRYDASASAARFGLAAGPTAYDERTRVEFLVGEAVLTSAPGGRLEWLVGAFAAHAEQESRLSISQPGGTPAYAESRDDGLHEAALFGEAAYAITPRLKLTAGARVFGAVSRTDTTRALAGGPVLGGRLKTTDLAPKLVLAFQANPDLMVYAQAAEGYRLGGFNTSGLAGEGPPGPGGAQPSLRYGADELWSYEIGTKAALFASRLQLQAAVFQAVWRNVQSDQFLTSGLPYTANVGRAAGRGVEVEASYRIGPRLALKTNLILNGPELARIDPNFAGRRDAGLPVAPRFSAIGQLDWSRPLGGGLTLGVQAQAEYVGRSRVGFGPVTGPAMGGYLTNRLSAQIASARWRVRLFAENLADARADTFSFGNPFDTSLGPFATPLRPRTVGAAFSADL